MKAFERAIVQSSDGYRRWGGGGGGNLGDQMNPKRAYGSCA